MSAGSHSPPKFPESHLESGAPPPWVSLSFLPPKSWARGAWHRLPWLSPVASAEELVRRPHRPPAAPSTQAPALSQLRCTPQATLRGPVPGCQLEFPPGPVPIRRAPVPSRAEANRRGRADVGPRKLSTVGGDPGSRLPSQGHGNFSCDQKAAPLEHPRDEPLRDKPLRGMGCFSSKAHLSPHAGPKSGAHYLSYLGEEDRLR